jgi:hypothetical protein
VSALVLTIECSGGPSEFLGIPCDPTPPQHDRCPGSHTTPGLLGGWHCSCSCHLRQPLSGYTQTAREGR